MASLARLPLCLGLLALAASALAQGVRIDAPAGRLVAPGEFATLVFRLDGAAGLALEGEVATELGWSVLRQPGAIVLEGGGAEPLAVTVVVPADAEASETDTVTLRLRGDGVDASSSATLTVAEIVDLDLAISDTVLIDGDGVSASVVNRGNVAVEAELTLLSDGAELSRTTLTLAPGGSESVPLPIVEEGFYTLLLVAGDRRIERPLRALRFGVLRPDPLVLYAEAGASLDSGGRWNLHVTLEGALSDFVSVDARLDSDLERSFLTLSDDERRQLVHLGSDPPTPFRLSLPSPPGLVVLSEQEPWGSVFAGGWRPDGGATAYAGFRYGDRDDRLDGVAAAVAGWSEGAPLAVGRGQLSLPNEAFDLTLDGGFAWRASRLDIDGGVEAQRIADRARASLELRLRDGFADAARFEVQGRASDPLSSLYGDVAIAVGPTAEGSWRIGTDVALPTALPGQLNALLQIGAPDSFATVRYIVDLGSGWRAQNSLGALGDARGFGLRAASLWRWGSGPGNGAQLGFDLTYRPQSGAVDGRVDGRYQTEIDAVALLASAGWDLTERALALGASAAWRGGDWTVQLDLDGGYLYGGVADPFRIEVGLQGSYGFDLSPDPALTELAGGRNLGRLAGRVSADGNPIAGVEIEVDRFRLRSDSDGRFEAEVAPGSYRIRLDVATLPVDVRSAGPTEIEVEVLLREPTEVAFALERTASLTGRVLVDSDADGVADDPPTGVRARIVLVEANGVVRSIESGADGRFEARGVTPGAIALRLIEQPFGSSVVGPETLQLTAAAGERVEATFLSQPAAATAQTFGNGLRIAGIEVEPPTAPPGAAPLLRIAVRGEAERVSVEGPAGIVELERSGDRWIGRYPLADDAAAGPLAVRVVAEGGGERSERRATLLIDPSAPLFEASAGSPVVPGGALAIAVDVYVGATAVRAVATDAGSVTLTEGEPGRWQGELPIPNDLVDGVYELSIELERDDGRRVGRTLRYRVMVEGAP